MIDDEDELGVYFKKAQRNILDAIHVSQVQNMSILNQSRLQLQNPASS